MMINCKTFFSNITRESVTFPKVWQVKHRWNLHLHEPFFSLMDIVLVLQDDLLSYVQYEVTQKVQV